MAEPSNFNNVVVQSNFEGADGTTPTTGLDDSTFDHATTFTGTTDISSDTAQFGLTCVHTAAGGISFTQQTNEFAVGINDVTIEMFAQRLEAFANQWALTHYVTSGNQRAWGLRTTGSTHLELFWTANGGSPGSAKFTNISWPNDSALHHIVVVRSGSDLATFTDGTRNSAITDSTDVHDSTGNISVGETISSGSKMSGYYDALRITIGEALYDPTLGSLTVPTAYYGTGALPEVRGRGGRRAFFSKMWQQQREARPSLFGIRKPALVTGRAVREAYEKIKLKPALGLPAVTA